ncbi:MAG: phosphatidylglycerophosphatase A [Syntrophobacterales bacterium]|nr:phosphatidylglycerophosphatase A [Syntrophobacterales bacterium]
MRRRDNVSSWVVLVSTAGGLGLLPLMPGTWGTLGGVFIHGLGVMLFRSTLGERLFIIGAVFLITTVGAVVLPECQRFWKEKDPKKFVIDEVVGYLMVPLFLGRTLPFWSMAIMGFLLFRLFDVVKPPGARQLNNRDDFLGVMGDDIVSGIYAAICLKVISAVIWRS